MIRILLSVELGKRKWTKADLARKTGIRANTIGDIYNEIATSIKIEHLNRICEALNCDAANIIQYVPDCKPEAEADTPVHKQPPKM